MKPQKTTGTFKQKLLAITLFIGIGLASSGQQASVFNNEFSLPESDEIISTANFVKVNIPALFAKNYSLTYERILNQRFSAALSVRIMPNTTLPFKNRILELVDDDDPDTRDVINSFRLSNMAITPEFRFYVGPKGYGQGFYIAPFYRYMNFKTSSLTIDFQGSSGPERSLTLDGKMSAHTGGILFGAQWAMGSNICLDWWILGPHIGSGNGTFKGTTTPPLDASEQNDLRQELEDLDIPLINETVTVDANGATMKLKGLWGGLRAGICFGIRF